MGRPPAHPDGLRVVPLLACFDSRSRWRCRWCSPSPATCCAPRACFYVGAGLIPRAPACWRPLAIENVTRAVGDRDALVPHAAARWRRAPRKPSHQPRVVAATNHRRRSPAARSSKGPRPCPFRVGRRTTRAAHLFHCLAQREVTFVRLPGASAAPRTGGAGSSSAGSSAPSRQLRRRRLLPRHGMHRAARSPRRHGRHDKDRARFGAARR